MEEFQAVLTLQSEQEKRQSLQGEFEKLMSSEANKFAEKVHNGNRDFISILSSGTQFQALFFFKIKTLELMKTMEVESLRKEISQLNKEVTMLRSDSHLREQDHREKCRELELVID